MTNHLMPEQIARYRAGSLPSVEELLAVEEHLDACDTCRDALRATASAAAGSLVSKLVAVAGDYDCVDERLLRRYADGRADAAEREIVETHVEDCARCAASLDARRAARAHKERFSFRRALAPAALGMTTMAAAVALFGFWTRTQQLTIELTAERQAREKAIAALETTLAGQLELREDAAPELMGEPDPAFSTQINPGDTQRGGSATPTVAVSLVLVRPVATFVLDVHPVLEVRPRKGATDYQVTVTLPNAPERPIKTAALSPTRWRVTDTLRRGQIYGWRVTARENGQDVRSLAARFGVLDSERAAWVERAERAYAGRHLTLGVLYAQAGLFDDAERELRALLKANPQHAAARDLLRELRAKRPR